MSYDSYIKPQLCVVSAKNYDSCMSYDFYIKPQRWGLITLVKLVVCLTIPTSNHNTYFSHPCTILLYVLRFLHQTTTSAEYCLNIVMLYVLRFLHQTTTNQKCVPLQCQLYVLRFLHQTTTRTLQRFLGVGCMSYDSYIKPQHTLSRLV